MDRTYDGRSVRMLTLIYEYTRECLTIDVARKINAMDVVERLADLFVFRGTPKYIRSDNEPEFVSKKIRHWLKVSGVQTLYIEPGSPWENEYNTIRPHSSLNYRPPAPEAIKLECLENAIFRS